MLLLAASKCNATALSFLYLGHLIGPDLYVCVCVCGCACVARQDMTYESSSEHDVMALVSVLGDVDGVDARDVCMQGCHRL